MSDAMLERPRWWPWLLAVALMVTADQALKALVRASFSHEGDSVDVIGSYVRLTYVQNPGVAFGLEPFPPFVLLAFGTIATVALLIYHHRLVLRADALKWPVYLFLCGAIGNSIDRAALGSVTDFVDLDFPDLIMQRWPVFNLADSCVTIGIAILLWQTLFAKHSPTLSPTPPVDRLNPPTVSSASGSGTDSPAAGSFPDASSSGDLPK